MACQALLQHPSQNEILREAFGQRLTVSQIYGTTFACPTPFFPGWNIIAKIETAFTHISIHFDGLDLCKDHTHCFHSCVYFAACGNCHWLPLDIYSPTLILHTLNFEQIHSWISEVPRPFGNSGARAHPKEVQSFAGTFGPQQDFQTSTLSWRWREMLGFHHFILVVMVRLLLNGHSMVSS